MSFFVFLEIILRPFLLCDGHLVCQHSQASDDENQNLICSLIGVTAMATLHKAAQPYIAAGAGTDPNETGSRPVKATDERHEFARRICKMGEAEKEA